jgi:hypothetical protein
MVERPDSYSDAYDTQIRRVKPEMGGRSLALPPIMFVLDYHTGDFLEAMSPSRF